MYMWCKELVELSNMFTLNITSYSQDEADVDHGNPLACWSNVICRQRGWRVINS